MLSELPEIGHQRRDVSGRCYRFFTVHPYLIVYRYEPPIVTVVRFLHGARKVSRIMDERP
ncbi:MAG: type II toxin-antitoxin system RelE/ParE family toxin [Planctomycetes bacterium]|nr:type II toxin-antitoxin system RelE/ParE family toxin [Planctomycetota bacterium]